MTRNVAIEGVGGHISVWHGRIPTRHVRDAIAFSLSFCKRIVVESAARQLFAYLCPILRNVELLWYAIETPLIDMSPPG